MTFSQTTPDADSHLAAGLLRRGIAASLSSRSPIRLRLEDLARKIDRDDLFRPAIACRILPSSREEPQRWRIAEAILEGSILERLAGATEVAVAFATIGSSWAEATSALFRHGDAVAGCLLDEVGTRILGLLARRIEARIRIEARRQGLCSGSPLEPGQPGLSLTVQPLLAELVDARSAGIEVTPHGMLLPAKSFSMLIGIGASMRRWPRAAMCRECPSWVQCRRYGLSWDS